MLPADYETLRALDSENVPATTSMSEEEINALPVHKYKVAGPQGWVTVFFLLAYDVHLIGLQNYLKKFLKFDLIMFFLTGHEYTIEILDNLEIFVFWLNLVQTWFC